MEDDFLFFREEMAEQESGNGFGEKIINRFLPRHSHIKQIYRESLFMALIFTVFCTLGDYN